MKKWLIICLALFLSVGTAIAQDEDEGTEIESKEKVKRKPEWLRNLRVGGVFGLSFSSFNGGNQLYFELSPDISYRLHERVQVGGGPIYRLWRFKYNFGGTDVFHHVGGRLWTRVFIFEGLFAQVQGEVLNGNIVSNGPRITQGQVFLGGGYYASFSSNAGLFITVLVPLIENDFYPNRNPQINIGFGVGF